jgi:hypothetical protein
VGFILPYLGVESQISPYFAVETTAAVCENRIYGTLAREKKRVKARLPHDLSILIFSFLLYL